MSLVFFALVAIATWREAFPEFGPYQADFKHTLEVNAQLQAAQRFTFGIKQIWNPKIKVVDRCVTCHLGYDWGSVLPAASMPQPLKPHPNLPYMDKHPFQQFGCTPCHGGQGWATTAEDAHNPKDWDDPMFSETLARKYGLTQGEMMQMRCNFCHRHDVETPGMDVINLAKKLMKKKKCAVCHTIEGEGGNTGPELTFYGDKDPDLVDFTNVRGPHTLMEWNIEHLSNPDAITPKTQMPQFNFTPEQARALAMLVLSWRREVFPPEYIPPPLEAAPEASPAAAASPSNASPAGSPPAGAPQAATSPGAAVTPAVRSSSK